MKINQYINLKELLNETGLDKELLQIFMRERAFPIPSVMADLETIAWNKQDVNEWIENVYYVYSSDDDRWNRYITLKKLT